MLQPRTWQREKDGTIKSKEENMKKLILALFVLHALCAAAWAADLKWDKYYVYCTASGRPDVGNGNQASSYMKNYGTNPSVFIITPSGFSNRAEADKYARSLGGKCPKK